MPEPDAQARRIPRPPAYAWAWLQRSRPVLEAAAERLTGGPPTAGFVDELRERFEEDAFTRDILVGVIADVAFNGRVPRARPAGVSWDRGLTWWAAALAGTTPSAFERRGATSAQPPLFDPPGADLPDQGARTAPSRERAVARLAARAPERAALAARLRDLLSQAHGDSVPVQAVRDLLAEFDDSRP